MTDNKKPVKKDHKVTAERRLKMEQSNKFEKINDYEKRAMRHWDKVCLPGLTEGMPHAPYEERTFEDETAELRYANNASTKYHWVYVGLESYESRYTKQLTAWNKAVFDKLWKPHVTYVQPKWTETDRKLATSEEVNTIKVGEVLDATSRGKHAMGQIATILDMIENGEIDRYSILLFEDMYHPGIDALFYYLSQVPVNRVPNIYFRCLAQTIDPDDFVHRTQSHRISDWMRHYEQMVLNAPGVRGIIAASTEMLANMRTAAWNPKLQVLVSGLPFGKSEVRSRVAAVKPFHERPLRVTFASRAAPEKQPWFFIELAKAFRKHFNLTKKQVEFCFVSGVDPLESKDYDVRTALHEAKRNGTCKFYSNLSKEQYYEILNDSRVLFNCSLQDWVSNTVSEADALGCNLLFPAYRSFPEVFENDHTRLYTPWSITDACEKLLKLLMVPHPLRGRISTIQDKSILNTITLILRDLSDLRTDSNSASYSLDDKSDFRKFTLHDDSSGANFRHVNSEWVSAAEARILLSKHIGAVDPSSV